VEPSFARLEHEAIDEKSPGEIARSPRAAVVGEEACASDSTQLRGLEAELCWLVDPIDGTASFVAGSPDWAL